MNPIITASLTGPAATSKQTPAMPRTPEEIAKDAKAAYEAGAAVIHILCVLFSGGLPRWMGWPLLAAYAWFVGTGLLGG